MSISFRILPDRGLVFVEYLGVINVSDSARAFGAYAIHPDYRPGQKQLVDLGGVTGWEKDFARLMALQARKAEALFAPDLETLFVYHAPGDETRAMARMILRSWDGMRSVVPLIAETEAEALALLGQPETSFASLLRSA